MLHRDAAPGGTVEPTIVRNEHANRFETSVENQLCVLEYRLDAGRLLIDHVGVPVAVGGRGIAGSLVRAALEFARADGRQVVPRCPYAQWWLDRHPEYAALVARA